MNQSGRMDRIDEVLDLARRAFASGDLVTGIAALQLAAELLHIEKSLRPIHDIADLQPHIGVPIARTP